MKINRFVGGQKIAWIAKTKTRLRILSAVVVFCKIKPHKIKRSAKKKIFFFSINLINQNGKIIIYIFFL